MGYQGVINRYREFLPVSDQTPIVTLQEGDTPLIPAKYLSQEIDCEVFLKYEGLNPTGSFKDRGMTMAVSKALEEGSTAVMCASTGNTSASAAAYAAQCGLKCIVLIPKGKIALGKLAQAMIHQAQVVAIEGNFDEALKLVRKITDEHPIALVNSLNPYRIEGQKTAAFEIIDWLKDAPQFHAIPVGNAGNITAYWKGYQEYHQHKKSSRFPRMLGFQAEKSAPIVDQRIIESPETIATAIRIGNPASWKMAETARDQSGGLINKVTDEEIIDAYKILASKEGIFVEPASAASVAGIIKLKKSGFFNQNKGRIVCTLTGHGLKDPEVAISNIEKPVTVKADYKTVLQQIGYA